MNLWGSKERVYPDDNKLAATVMGGLIVITAIIIYGIVLVAKING